MLGEFREVGLHRATLATPGQSSRTWRQFQLSANGRRCGHTQFEKCCGAAVLRDFHESPSEDDWQSIWSCHARSPPSNGSNVSNRMTNGVVGLDGVIDTVEEDWQRTYCLHRVVMSPIVWAMDEKSHVNSHTINVTALQSLYRRETVQHLCETPTSRPP